MWEALGRKARNIAKKKDNEASKKVMVRLKRTPKPKNKSSAWVPSENKVLSRAPIIRYALPHKS